MYALPHRFLAMNSGRRSSFCFVHIHIIPLRGRSSFIIVFAFSFIHLIIKISGYLVKFKLPKMPVFMMRKIACLWDLITLPHVFLWIIVGLIHFPSTICRPFLFSVDGGDEDRGCVDGCV